MRTTRRGLYLHEHESDVLHVGLWAVVFICFVLSAVFGHSEHDGGFYDR